MSDLIIVSIIAAIPATIGALGSWYNIKKISKLEVKVDGRLTELLNISGIQQRSEGHEEGRQSEILEDKNRRIENRKDIKE